MNPTSSSELDTSELEGAGAAEGAVDSTGGVVGMRQSRQLLLQSVERTAVDGEGFEGA